LAELFAEMYEQITGWSHLKKWSLLWKWLTAPTAAKDTPDVLPQIHGLEIARLAVKEENNTLLGV
jgi:hypothetical protein